MGTERLSRTRAQTAGYEVLPGPPSWARRAACAGKATPIVTRGILTSTRLPASGKS